MQNIPSTKMTGSCHLTSPSSLPRWCAALIVLAALLLDIGLASAQQQISTASKTLSGTYNFSAVGTWASGGIPTNGNPAGFVQIILDNGGNGATGIIAGTTGMPRTSRATLTASPRLARITSASCSSGRGFSPIKYSSVRRILTGWKNSCASPPSGSSMCWSRFTTAG
jgi:hypothetical protein